MEGCFVAAGSPSRNVSAKSRGGRDRRSLEIALRRRADCQASVNESRQSTLPPSFEVGRRLIVYDGRSGLWRRAGMNQISQGTTDVTDEPWCNYEDLVTGVICGAPGMVMGGTTAGCPAYKCTVGHEFMLPPRTPEVRRAPGPFISLSLTPETCPFCPRSWVRQPNGLDGCGRHFWSPVCGRPECENPTDFVKPKELEATGALNATCLAQKDKCCSWLDVRSTL
jgi:hypothetical protein